MPEMSDEYNGWTNRETWALNLWLSNDQGLYNMTRERVAQALDTGDDFAYGDVSAPRVAGEAVKDLWDELTDPDEGLMTAENILKMVRDVGSLYRVDWDEIGAAWLEDVTEGGDDETDREAQYHDFSDGYGQPVTENPAES